MQGLRDCIARLIAVVLGVLLIALPAGAGPFAVDYSKQTERNNNAHLIRNVETTLRLLMEWSEQYYANEGNGEYGDIFDLKAAGYLPEFINSRTIISGYAVNFYIDRINDVIVLVAYADEDTGLPGLMLEQTGRIMLLAPYTQPLNISMPGSSHPLMNASENVVSPVEFSYGSEVDGSLNEQFYEAFDGVVNIEFSTWSASGETLGFLIDRGNQYPFLMITYDPDIYPTAVKLISTWEITMMDLHAKGLLRWFGSLESEFVDGGSENYGTFSSIAGAGWLGSSLDVDDYAFGYNLLWGVSTDGSDFTIATIPEGHSEELQAMIIDSDNRLMSLSRVNSNDSAYHNWLGFIATQGEYYFRNGTFIRPSGTEPGLGTEFLAYMDEDLDFYILKPYRAVERDTVYLSVTGDFYLAHSLIQ